MTNNLKERELSFHLSRSQMSCKRAASVVLVKAYSEDTNVRNSAFDIQGKDDQDEAGSNPLHNPPPMSLILYVKGLAAIHFALHELTTAS